MFNATRTPDFLSHPRSGRRYRRVITRRRKSFSPILVRLAVAASLLAILALPFLAAAGAVTYFQVFERILPGVYAGDSRLGGLTVEQAAVRIQKEWNMERKLQVGDGMHTWELAPAVLGLSVDALQTARQAYAVGHGQDLYAIVDQMLYSLQHGWGVAPVVTFDAQTARAGLQALAAQASLAPRNATLRLEGEQLVAVPAEVGYTIDVDATLAALASDPRAALLAGSLRVPLKPVAAPVTDVSAVLAEAQRLLDTPLKLKAYDPISDEWLEFSAPRSEIASWLQVKDGEGGPQVRISTEGIVHYARSLSDGLGPERWLDVDSQAASLAESFQQGAAATLIVRHRPTTYTVQPGETLLKIGWKLGIPYWMIVRANPGLDQNSLVAGQQLTIPSKDELLPLPVVPNKRVVISISKQRLWMYQDGQLLSEHVISTGIDRSPTQPGIFQVQTHELNAYASVWDLYMPHFLGIYEAWPGFMNGIHGLPTLSNGRRLWASILGRPASYGCIILDLNAAENLFNWAENGVVVEIQP